MSAYASFNPAPAVSTQIAAVSDALAQSLIGDPFYRAVTVESGANEAKRLQMLASYFELAIAEGEAVGEVHYAGADGAAIWMPGEASRADLERHGAARNAALATLLGVHGYTNYSRICRSMEAQLPMQLHDAWYLSILGVRPEARGKRLGQGLLELTLKRADEHGVTCFLETFNPVSLPFYRRLGFDQDMRFVEEVTGSPYFLMVRRGAQR